MQVVFDRKVRVFDDVLALVTFVISLGVLAAQRETVVNEPVEIADAFTRPNGAGVVDVCRLVRTADYGTQYLRCFQTHLDNVFVALHLSGEDWVGVQNEDVHFDTHQKMLPRIKKNIAKPMSSSSIYINEKAKHPHPAMVRSWLIAEHMINTLRLGYGLAFRVRLKGCCGTLVLQPAAPQ